MKRGYLVGMLIGVSAAPVGAMASALPPMLSFVPKGPVVQLSASDSVEQAPDVVRINITLRTQNRDRASAIATSNAGLAKIKAALTANGVAASEIEQGYFSAREQFDGEGSARRRKGFAIEANLSVKLHKLDALGDAMGAAIAAGATDVDNPQFDVENKAPILEKLTASATARGRAQAMLHARINGASGVRLLTVSDSDDRFTGPANKAALFEAREDANISPDLAPRPVTISVSLDMVFELTN